MPGPFWTLPCVSLHLLFSHILLWRGVTARGSRCSPRTWFGYWPLTKSKGRETMVVKLKGIYFSEADTGKTDIASRCRWGKCGTKVVGTGRWAVKVRSMILLGSTPRGLAGPGQALLLEGVVLVSNTGNALPAGCFSWVEREAWRNASDYRLRSEWRQLKFSFTWISFVIDCNKLCNKSRTFSVRPSMSLPKTSNTFALVTLHYPFLLWFFSPLHFTLPIIQYF